MKVKFTRLVVQTSEGEGEALRGEDNEWVVNLPWTSYRINGTPPEVMRDMQQKVKEYEGNDE